MNPEAFGFYSDTLWNLNIIIKQMHYWRAEIAAEISVNCDIKRKIFL